MKKIVNLVVFCILFFSADGFASKISEAEAAYNSGNYDEAINLYKTVVESEGVSGQLYYDMGNAYYKAGNLGNAVLYYEKAKKLLPRNKSIINNLNFVTAKVVDANKAAAGDKKNSVEYDTPTFFQTVNKMISEDRSSDNWAVLAVISFILFLGFAAMYFFTPGVLARKTGFFSGLIFIAFTVVFTIFAFMAASALRTQDEAIIMVQNTPLHQEPESNSKEVSVPLRDGTKVEILESSVSQGGSTEWYKVRLNSQTVGWINSDNIELI